MRYKNSEGYDSPTEGEALAHITHEEREAARLERRKNMKYVLAWSNPLPYDSNKECSSKKHRRQKP